MMTRVARRPQRRRVRHLAVVLAAVIAGVSGPAAAEPARPDPAARPPTIAPSDDGSRLVAAVPGPGRVLSLTVQSAAMGRTVTVAVLPAADPTKPAPTLYLLNGFDGGTTTGDWRTGKNWLTSTDVADFVADKQVTTVVPIGGAGSFYADWRTDDPDRGRMRWTTFLTRELPPLIDSAFHGTGARAVAGVSMSATSVFQLAMAAPGLYRGLGSYSGCVRTSDPMGQLLVDTLVTGTGGNAMNMWGPPTDPAWAAHDPYLHADRLRGTAVYVASGSGAPGDLDTLDGPGIRGDPQTLADQVVVGGMLDTVAGRCTRQLRDRFQQLNIPATVDLRATGTHSWGYWQQDLHNSWPLLSAALGG